MENEENGRDEKNLKLQSEVLAPALLWSWRSNTEAAAKDIIVTTRINIKVAYKHVMICDTVNWKFFNIKKI